MVRSHSAGIVITGQSYAGLREDADRILGAAAGLIIHQCADPERLLLRGGQSLSFQRRITFTERGMGKAVREYAVGEGVLAETETLKVDADTVKQLDPGACVLIAGGRAQHVLVSPGAEIIAIAVYTCGNCSVENLRVSLSGTGELLR
jgi:hypothetical protein